MGLQNASNDHMICRILHDKMPQIILRLMINDISSAITSPCNSVRVVLLIARGRLVPRQPRVNDRKGIQRRRC